MSPPPAHLLHGCTDKFHECIRMNATCSVNVIVNCSNNLTLYSNHFNKTCKSLLR
jgi:hypothetical protein